MWLPALWEGIPDQAIIRLWYDTAFQVPPPGNHGEPDTGSITTQDHSVRPQITTNCMDVPATEYNITCSPIQGSIYYIYMRKAISKPSPSLWVSLLDTFPQDTLSSLQVLKSWIKILLECSTLRASVWQSHDKATRLDKSQVVKNRE